MTPTTPAAKWVLVTGAARRIGRAIALHLASEGWDIILHYNRSADDANKVADEIIEMGQQVVLAEIDLAKADLVAKLIPSLVPELGTISGLVNNASLFELDSQDPEGRLHHAINAEAPRLLSQAFYLQTPPDQTGAIVNILDGVPPEKNLGFYNQSKLALHQYTLEAARTFAPRVRVNGVAPGPILPNIRQSEQHFQAQIDATPLKRPITPDDIAHTVRFLLESPAITGEILHVDGGKHLDF